jgi:hypothetical protein
MAGEKETERKARNKPPHEGKWFDDFAPTNPVDPNAQRVRSALTALRKTLFVGNGLDPTKYATIIRIEPLQGHQGAGEHPKNASCGCGCS